MSEFFHGLHRTLSRMNWWLNAAMFGLLLIGFFFIYSACYFSDETWVRGLHKQQIKWAAIGAVCYVGFAWTDYRRLRSLAWWGYGAVLLLLALVLLVGEKHFGARRWLDVFGFSLQPSELAKLATITALAGVLSRPGRHMAGLGVLAGVLATALGPMALIVVEPDLGTAMIFVPIVFAMMFSGGMPMRHIVGLVALGAVLAGLILGALLLPDQLGASPETCRRIHKMTLLTEYQRERILVLFKSDRDPLGRGWNKMQSEISVGSGGVTGKGFLKGTQSMLGFLPRKVARTDFIYSVIAEEWGFVGSVVVLLLFSLIVLCGAQAALLSVDKMGRVLCMGVTGMIFCHVFINIAMTVGLMPITGVPLPLLSYGGSFMVVMMSALGMVQSVYVRARHTTMLA